MGHAVAQLVEALCYKLEGRGFDSEVTGFFNWPNPSSSTMALGSTQSLTEMSTKNLPGGEKGGQSWHHLWADCLEVMRESRRLTTLWDSTACCRDNFYLFFHCSLKTKLPAHSDSKPGRPKTVYKAYKICKIDRSVTTLHHNQASLRTHTVPRLHNGIVFTDTFICFKIFIFQYSTGVKLRLSNKKKYKHGIEIIISKSQWEFASIKGPAHIFI
jgi:hypothetical protein